MSSIFENRLNNSLWFKCVLILITTAVIVSGTGFAADENPEVHAIQPVPGFEIDEEDLSEAIDRHFGCTGKVDFINKDRIVLNDASYPIAPGVSISGLREGNYAGIRLNKAGQVIDAKRLQRPR